MASASRQELRYTQNFLHSRKLISYLISRTSLESEDTVLEIGPGKGIITVQLAGCCAHVLAVEKDPKLVSQLRSRFTEERNVILHQTDFLEYPLPVTPYKVFANIPFNITADILRKLLMGPNQPSDTYLIVQQEAAEKFGGFATESLGSLLLKPWFIPEVIHRFVRRDFVPTPGVDIVLIRFSKRDPPLVSRKHEDLYRDFVVSVFTAWTPSIGSTLTSMLGATSAREMLRYCGIDPSASPTVTDFARWLSLFRAFESMTRRQQKVRSRIRGAHTRWLERQSGLQKQRRTRTRSSKNSTS